MDNSKHDCIDISCIFISRKLANIVKLYFATSSNIQYEFP